MRYNQNQPGYSEVWLKDKKQRKKVKSFKVIKEQQSPKLLFKFNYTEYTAESS